LRTALTSFASITFIPLDPSQAGLASLAAKALCAGVTFLTSRALLSTLSGRAGKSWLARCTVEPIFPGRTGFTGSTPLAGRSGCACLAYGTGFARLALVTLLARTAVLSARAGRPILNHRKSRAILLLYTRSQAHDIGAQIGDDGARLGSLQLEFTLELVTQLRDDETTCTRENVRKVRVVRQILWRIRGL
jgi:hypothetical protein